MAINEKNLIKVPAAVKTVWASFDGEDGACGCFTRRFEFRQSPQYLSFPGTFYFRRTLGIAQFIPDPLVFPVKDPLNTFTHYSHKHDRSH